MTSERPTPRRHNLASVRVGGTLRVSDVDPAYAEELLREGLLPGALVRVQSRTPLGGPVIVVMGRSRLALSANVAAAVRGEPPA